MNHPKYLEAPHKPIIKIMGEKYGNGHPTKLSIANIVIEENLKYERFTLANIDQTLCQNTCADSKTV